MAPFIQWTHPFLKYFFFFALAVYGVLLAVRSLVSKTKSESNVIRTKSPLSFLPTNWQEEKTNGRNKCTQSHSNLSGNEQDEKETECEGKSAFGTEIGNPLFSSFHIMFTILVANVLSYERIIESCSCEWTHICCRYLRLWGMWIVQTHNRTASFKHVVDCLRAKERTASAISIVWNGRHNTWRFITESQVIFDMEQLVYACVRAEHQLSTNTSWK